MAALRFAVICCLISGHIIYAADPIPKFPELKTFTKSVHITSSIHNRITTVVFDSEEFYDHLNTRGRMHFSQGDETEQYYYDQESGQIDLINGDNSKERFCMTDKWEKFATLNPNHIRTFFMNTLSEDIQHGFPIMMGTMAVIRRISQTVEATKDMSKSWEGIEIVRGIKCNKWRFLLPNSTKENPMEATLYFSVGDWLKFENVDEPLPVRILIKGSEKVDGVEHKYDEEYDYYLIEPYPEMWRTFAPVLGLGCTGRKSSKETEYPGTSTFFPNEYSVTIESYHVHDEGDKNEERHLHKNDLYVDADVHTVRLDSFDMDQGFKSLIWDQRRGVVFETKDGTCRIFGLDPASVLVQDEELNIMRTAAEALKLDGEFVYIGKYIVRGIMCEVWETIKYNYMFPTFKDDSTSKSKKFSKAVITHFFTSDQVTLLDPLTDKIPIMSIYTGYDKYNERDMKQTKVYEQEVNYFDFKPLYYGSTYMDKFDVRHCYTDPDARRYYDLYVKVDSEATFKLKRYVSHLRQMAAKALIGHLGISPLRIPTVDIEFQDKGFIVSVMILERPLSINSFNQARAKEGWGFLPPATVTSKGTKVRYVEDCATQALSEKMNTFYYCEDRCITTNSLYIAARPVEARASKEPVCGLYYRGRLPNDVDGGRLLVQESTLAQVHTALFASANELTIDLSETIGLEKWFTQFLVTEIFESKGPDATQASKRLLEMTIPGMLLKPETESTLVIPSSQAFQGLGACYRACRDENSISCRSFSFCRRDGVTECALSSELLTSGASQADKDAYLAPDSHCNMYIRTYLDKYTKQVGRVSLIPGDKEPAKGAARSELDCSRLCSEEKDFKCQSFEWCDGSRCLLRKQSFLELTDSGSSSKLVESTKCDLYSLKYIDQFTNLGSDLIDSEPLTEFAELSVEDCATRCATDISCKSINYCPKTSTSNSSSCQLFSTSVLDSDITTRFQPVCKNYERAYKPVIQKLPEPDSKASKKGFSAGGFFFLIFFMFLLGIGFGGGGYFGFRHYQRTRSAGTGLGISIRFMRHKDDEEEA